MMEGKQTHILLRGADGTLYALNPSILNDCVLDTSTHGHKIMREMDDDMSIIDTMAFTFTTDEAGNPQANGNSCAFAQYAAEAFPKLENGDHFIYLNLDFDFHTYGKTDE